MNKIEEMITETKLYEMLKKRDQDKAKKTILCILAVVGAVVAIRNRLCCISFPFSGLSGRF